MGATLAIGWMSCGRMTLDLRAVRRAMSFGECSIKQLWCNECLRRWMRWKLKEEIWIGGEDDKKR